MRTVLLLAAAAALGGCIPETTDESGADAGLATTEQDLDFVPLCTTAPTFTDVARDTAKTLVREPLTYVAGSFTDVVFTLPGCPWFSGVTVDGVALGTTSGIDNPSRYQVVSDTPITGGHRLRVRLILANSQTGAQKAVKIWASNALIGGSRSLDLTWVGVADVNRTARSSMTAEQLRGMIARSAYDRFGDDGFEGATGLHHFDYQGLSITIDDAIHLHAGLQYRVYSTPWNCDLTLTVDGKFKMSRFDSDPNVAGDQWKFRLDWIKASLSDPYPFHVSVSENNLCTLGLATIVGGVVAFWESVLLDDVKGAINAGFSDGFTCGLNVPGLTCADGVASFEYAPGELRAVIDPVKVQVDGGQSITVKAPYVASAPGVVGGQLVLRANETVLIAQEGLVNACFTDVGNPATCNGSTPRKVGANGYFLLSDKNSYPVPDPFEYGSPPIPQREQALAANTGMVRTASLLPALSAPTVDPFHPPPDHYVGSLLARHGARRQDLSSPCFLKTDITAGAPPVAVALGRNDRALNGTPFGSGTALVTAWFVANSDNQCPSF